MKTGDRPRRDTGVIDDWDDNDSPSPLALREVAKLSDDQPLDLVFGLWDFFHDTNLTDFYCDYASRVAVRRSRGTRPLKPLGRCRSHSALAPWPASRSRSEEHTSELQSLAYLVCRLLLEKKKLNDGLFLIT